MTEIQEFMKLLGEKQTVKKLKAYIQGLENPSSEFQLFLIIYSLATNSAYVKLLKTISTETMARLGEMIDAEPNFYMDNFEVESNLTFKKVEKNADAYIALLKTVYTESYVSDIDIGLLSDNDKLKVIEFIHKRNICWDTEMEEIAAQSEDFQIKYINKFAKYFEDNMLSHYDGSFAEKANQLLLKKLSSKAIVSSITSNRMNLKWKAKIPKEMYEKAVLDFIKSDKKWSLTISGNSVYSRSITEFHKNPGLGLLNTALLKVLSSQEKKEFLKKKPSFTQSEKIKYAKKIFINIKSDDVSIPLTDKKMIDTVLMIKTLET